MKLAIKKLAIKRREAALDIYTAMFGAFLCVSPWLFAYHDRLAREATLATGAALLAVSLLAVVAFREWEEWINLAIGLWLLAAPFALGFPHHAPAMHVAIGIGAAVTFLALLELWLIHNPDWFDGVEPRDHSLRR